MLGEMRRGGGVEMRRVPEQQCKGVAGHVEVGESYEGRDGRVGGELGIVDAACIAQRVTQNHKRLVKRLVASERYIAQVRGMKGAERMVI